MKDHWQVHVYRKDPKHEKTVRDPVWDSGTILPAQPDLSQPVF
jgi:hypothetical protein